MYHKLIDTEWNISKKPINRSANVYYTYIDHFQTDFLIPYVVHGRFFIYSFYMKFYGLLEYVS
jgi:hypothetical protein